MVIFANPETPFHFIKFKHENIFHHVKSARQKESSLSILKSILKYPKYHETINLFMLQYQDLSIFHPLLQFTPFRTCLSFCQSPSREFKLCHPGRWVVFPGVTEHKSEPSLQPSVIVLCKTHFPICSNWERCVIELIFQVINQLVSINASKFISCICSWLCWCAVVSMVMLLQSVCVCDSEMLTSHKQESKSSLKCLR